jgi:hypothetical protein
LCVDECREVAIGTIARQLHVHHGIVMRVLA